MKRTLLIIVTLVLFALPLAVAPVAARDFCSTCLVQCEKYSEPFYYDCLDFGGDPALCLGTMQAAYCYCHNQSCGACNPAISCNAH